MRNFFRRQRSCLGPGKPLVNAWKKTSDQLPVGGWRRFLLSGAFNTLVSYALYLVLLRAFAHGVAYTMAYAAGIVLAYVLFRCFVYESRGDRWSVAWVALAYGVQYLVGLGCVHLWVALGGWAVVAPLFSLVITTPMMYLLSRRIFARTRDH